MNPNDLLKKYEEIFGLLFTDLRRLDESNLGVLQTPFQRAYRAVGVLVEEITELC